MSGLRCQAKRGVLTLRTCGEPATATCDKCQRLTCAQHLSPGGTRCLDCVAREAQAATMPPDVTSYDDPAWSYGLRNWLLFSMLTDRDRYNQSDARSFDHRRDNDLIEKSPTGGGFLDS